MEGVYLQWKDTPPVTATGGDSPLSEGAKNDSEVIPMLCTVIDIRGDYAYVKYADTGVVSEVAIALLPDRIDVGDKLKFENYEFERI